MRLCMVLVSIFVSGLGITDLVNKIKFYINLSKLFHFKIYVNFSSLKVLSNFFVFENVIFSSQKCLTQLDLYTKIYRIKQWRS